MYCANFNRLGDEEFKIMAKSHSSYMPASGIIEYKSKQLIYGKYGMLNFLSKVFCDMTAEEKN